MTPRFIAFLTGLALLASCDSASEVPQRVDEDPLDVAFEVVTAGFTIPWGIEVIREEEYLFTERLGRLLYYQDGVTVALDGVPETVTVGDGRLVYGGLMDVSLHPRFDSNGLVYLAYVNEVGRMSVGRFTFENQTVQEFEVVFESNAFSIGSRIAWEDDDHFFVTQGLGGNPRPEPGPQNLHNDGGKIHRLMADGTVPADNPVFAGATAPTSVWSYGHRDPQGLYYDPAEGVLYATEHGPLGGDEFNVIEKGGNYGWPLFSYGLNYDRTPVSDLTEEEARQTTVLPRKHWNEALNVAPSGLERLSGSLFPAWDGSFILGSLAQQRLIAYDPDSGRTSILLEDVGRVRDVVQLPSGSLLLLIDAGSPTAGASGRIVKLTPR